MNSPRFTIQRLRCEYLENPLGLDETAPRLGWRLVSGERGLRQAAYRVRVASSGKLLAEGGADLWDSGKVESAQCQQVVYAGAELRSREVCHWCVELWDETDVRAVSESAFWTMGLLSPDDWNARWIAADPLVVARDPEARQATLEEPGTPAVFLRKFRVEGALRRATVFATARGIFELGLGGRRLGEDYFAPEWTDYTKRLHYRTYDATPLVAQGENALQATLGDGWWSGFVGWQERKGRYGSLENSLCLQLELEYADGRRETIGTDASWSCAVGPILSSDFMMGEVYDARREPRDWLPAREVAAPGLALVAQRSQPVRITEEIRPVSLNKVRSGVFIYDLGQNITGWVQLRATAPAGTRITLRHGERLNPDGTLYTENLRRAKATDVYVCRGGGESWQPHFTFHGFQYVELRAETPAAETPFRPDLSTIVGCVVHSAAPAAGHFECSHAGVNRLWLNGAWSQRDNFLSVPTDCPQRDERLGWMGDAQVFLRTASYNRDVSAFFTKWMTDVEDSQTPEGIYPDVAPRLPEDVHWTGLDDLCGGAGWADAGIIVPWTLWRVYGDTRVVEKHWRSMTAWLDYLERTNPDGLRTRDLRNNYGDWLCIPSDTSFRTQSPMKNLLATAYWADDAAKMARMARALGKPDEADRFKAMFGKVRGAFQREFVRADGSLAVETQTAYLLALGFDLLPKKLRPAAAERLVDNIKKLGWHLSTGFIGVSHLNPILTLAGRADVAYRLLLQDDYPSWLYPVKHGATTIWERWNGWTHADGFFEPSMNSFNHYSLGSVGEWLFRHVAGIELDADEPGFQRFVLHPFPGKGLDFAKASFDSPYGEIRSRWKLEGERFAWTVTVPPNTSAKVFIPSLPDTAVETDGLKLRGREGEFAICKAPAGTYNFSSTYRIRPASVSTHGRDCGKTAGAAGPRPA